MKHRQKSVFILERYNLITPIIFLICNIRRAPFLPKTQGIDCNPRNKYTHKSVNFSIRKKFRSEGLFDLPVMEIHGENASVTARRRRNEEVKLYMAFEAERFAYSAHVEIENIGSQLFIPRRIVEWKSTSYDKLAKLLVKKLTQQTNGENLRMTWKWKLNNLIYYHLLTIFLHFCNGFSRLFTFYTLLIVVLSKKTNIRN